MPHVFSYTLEMLTSRKKKTLTLYQECPSLNSHGLIVLITKQLLELHANIAEHEKGKLSAFDRA